jgi:hypothetical protein
VNFKIIKFINALALGFGLFVASNVQAANWLMLQGTEPDSSAPRARVWGFVQAQYQRDNSDANSTDGYIPPKLIGPDLSSQEQFNVNRARIGVRGTGFPLDGKTNYFILAELGNNGITAPDNRSVSLSDASITFSHIPRARIRVGLFKTPGAEEALQAIHVFDYINFTTVTNQLLLERFPNKEYTGNIAPVTLPGPTELNGFDKSVGAFRDVGVQVFDSFMTNDWEHSYAFMLGNGNGLNFGDNDDHLDKYIYWSSEKVFAGKGPRRQGLKLFAWSQTGQRQLDNTNDSTHNPTSFDRDRNGFGVKYLKGQFRASAEVMRGEGMIFVGPDKPSFYINDAGGPVTQDVGNGAEGEADGYYIEGGWYIPDTKWEIDVRYDVYNRLTDDNEFSAGPNTGKSFEMEFKTLTIGAQYHINRKTRVNFEVANREAEAIDFDSEEGPNDNLDGVDQRYAIQLTHIF